MDRQIDNDYINNKFVTSIIEGIHDWVRVIDKDNNVLYVNSSMTKELKRDTVGEKCYQSVGRKSPCANCISRMAVFDGKINQKEEVINGRIFSVVSSPVREDDGSISAVVEVLRDITETKNLNRKISEQNKILMNDIAMAKKLEFSLLPKGFVHDKLKFWYKYLPSEEIGGDFLSVFNIDESHVGIYIADVSGHGLPASILTVFINSGLSRRVLSPSLALEELYRRFNDAKFSSDLYITVFYAIIDTDNYTMTYTNSGHNVSPVIANDNRLEILLSPGIPICNWLNEPNYTDKTVNLLSGDRILLCTDGLIELKNNKNEQFGEKSLIDVLSRNNGTPEEIIEEIFIDARKFMNVNKIKDMADDITLAILKLK
ncbi:MAG: SpoIIE family protein phosphatase [Clostridia bacterium]|jgi:sigma-B regulation protein RsbU (phosphoserine phosphatase)